MKPNNFIKRPILRAVLAGILAIVVVAAVIIFILKPWEGDTTDPPDPTTVYDDTGQTTEPEDTEPTRPTAVITPEKEDIVCKQVASFSGSYVEDGKDAPVENVAAILVTNVTDEFLDLATIVYEIGGERASFKVTGLPPGKSAWVMESTGMTVENDAEFVYMDKFTVFRDDVITETEDVSLQYNGTMLMAVNNTSRTLEDVFVYYKVLHTDGNYLGGITYAVNFGTLEPGESFEKIAGHYKEGWTEIVRIGWHESQADETS